MHHSGCPPTQARHLESPDRSRRTVVARERHVRGTALRRHRGRAPRRRPREAARDVPLEGRRSRRRRPRRDDGRWDDDPDWEFTSAAADDAHTLYVRYDEAVAHSRSALAAAIAEDGLDRTVYLTGPHGSRANLRRIVLDLVEEYGRHTGHADLLRENVDGRVGEDPLSAC